MATLFSEMLHELNRGEVDAEATMQLRELIQAVQTTEKKGRVTIVVEVDRAGDRSITIRPTVTGKLPTADPEIALFYIDDQGGLSSDDPFQPRLHLSRDAEIRSLREDPEDDEP
jgi:hypothetical protein